MPLTLVTGPANAEKAGHVLTAYRAALARAPLLVVPTATDVERYRRELASAGAVFGVEVLRFGWLEREVARRAAIGGRPLGPLARERVAAHAVGATRLDRLARSAATPGFLPAFLALADELEEQRITPGRWYAAGPPTTMPRGSRRCSPIRRCRRSRRSPCSPMVTIRCTRARTCPSQMGRTARMCIPTDVVISTARLHMESTAFGSRSGSPSISRNSRISWPSFPPTM